jgi:hypothetical protein
MAAPRISANTVETVAKSAEINTGRAIHGEMNFVVASAWHSPVTIPRCAALCWRTMSMRVERLTIHKRPYPYRDPAATLDAQLPGSMNPTVTRSPGPRYLSRPFAPEKRRLISRKAFFMRSPPLGVR